MLLVLLQRTTSLRIHVQPPTVLTPSTWAAILPVKPQEGAVLPWEQCKSGEARGRDTPSVFPQHSTWVNCQFFLCGFSSKTKTWVVLPFPQWAADRVFLLVAAARGGGNLEKLMWTTWAQSCWVGEQQRWRNLCVFPIMPSFFSFPELWTETIYPWDPCKSRKSVQLFLYYQIKRPRTGF